MGHLLRDYLHMNIELELKQGKPLGPLALNIGLDLYYAPWLQEMEPLLHYMDPPPKRVGR
jgi:hypothetical protein